MDESLVTVFVNLGAKVVFDPKSTSGLSMKLPKADVPSWALQAMTKRFDTLGGFGRYHVYAVVRCEIKADKGAAFVVGVWDNKNLKGLGAVSFPIGKPAPSLTSKELDKNPKITYDTITSGNPVTDGEYHTYDLGVYNFSHENMMVWFGSTTSDIFVERVIFVREDVKE